jgi:hypothetical protein
VHKEKSITDGEISEITVSVKQEGCGRLENETGGGVFDMEDRYKKMISLDDEEVYEEHIPSSLDNSDEDCFSKSSDSYYYDQFIEVDNQGKEILSHSDILEQMQKGIEEKRIEIFEGE